MGERIIHPKFNVHENYKRVNIINPYRFAGGGGASYEPETVAYMASVGIADDATVYYSGTPQQITGNGFYVAVDKYVKALKTDGVFAKLKAVYPMIGGNASTHKWNLINPQDTDAAFRMLWYGGGFHSGTGFKGNATDAYGDTRWNSLNHGILNNESYGYYSRTDASGDYIDMGHRGHSNDSFIYSRYTDRKTLVKHQSNSYGTLPEFPDSLGFYQISRINSTNLLFQKGTGLYNPSLASTGRSGLNYYLASGNNVLRPTPREYSYAFIGEGLTETQMTAHYNAVQQLQTDLGRQV